MRRDFLTTEQSTERLQLHLSVCSRLLRDTRLPDATEAAGRQLRIPESKVAEYIECGFRGATTQ